MSARVTMLWHMHQPDYRDPATGQPLLPWVRLHATGAYDDMARMLERHPEVRCTVNLVPSLIEQLDEYAEGRAEDPYLGLARRPAEELDEEERGFILANFFHCNAATLIDPLPRFAELLARRGADTGPAALAKAVREFSDADLRDLQTLFHLAWLGFAAKAELEVARDLLDKGRDYTEEEKLALLDASLARLGEVIGVYSALAENGQIEISTSPYCHPILPLLLDSDSARRAMPQRPLPPRFSQPEDAARQVREALEFHERRLGRRPVGMWPSEGSVSPEVASLLHEHGVQWLVTDEGNLARSLKGGFDRRRDLYRPYVLPGGEVRALFRDRRLSDRIGFTYSRNPPEAAADDLCEAIRRDTPESGVMTLALDGENPWEYYPGRGEAFLEAFYRRLAGDFTTLTVAEAVALEASPQTLGRLHSGSWIESNYRVWIGDQETNRAWDLLGQTRRTCDRYLERATEEQRERAWRSLRAAEGSDWFWWFGDMFSSANDADFDRLFRAHLSAVHDAIGVAVPHQLKLPVAREARVREVQPPRAFIHPAIDGLAHSYFEWQGAAVYDVVQARSSMYRGENLFAAIRFGFDLEHLYLRLDPLTEDVVEDLPGRTIEVFVSTGGCGGRARIEVSADARLGVDLRVAEREGAAETSRPGGRAAFARVLEVAIPFTAFGVRAGDEVRFGVRVLEQDVELDLFPHIGQFVLTVPDENFELRNWSV